jgi:transposase
MAFIWQRKHPSGRVDYFLRQTTREGTKVRVTLNLYLGTADQLLDRLQKARQEFLDQCDLASFSFGLPAALLTADREIGLSKLVEEETGSQTTAQALLSFLLGRAEEPLSKNAMAAWYSHSGLPFLLPPPPALDTKSYNRHMDKLDEATVDRITFRLAENLKAKGFSSSLIFFDTTNFSTQQHPYSDDPDRILPRPGHPKDGDRQAKLVGLATATSPEHLPTFHKVYPGNENDARLFREVVKDMIATLVKLGEKAEDLCFVMDKGMNSKVGLTTLRSEKVHFVGSLKRSQVADLIAIPLDKFTKAYVTENDETILSYRGLRTVMGVKGAVVVSYNAAAEKRQSLDYAQAKERFLKEGTEIAEAVGKKHRGRPPTVAGTSRRLIGLIPDKWVKVFRFHIGPTLDDGLPLLKVRVWVDEKVEKEKRAGFGRTVIFTDREDWGDEKIVRTYFARSGMEEDYHVLKDVLLFPVMPIYHRLDKRIRVHVFLCVMGLLLYRYVQVRLERDQKHRTPIAQLAAKLKRIRLGVVSMDEGKTVKAKLEHMGPEEERIVKALGLSGLVPA